MKRMTRSVFTSLLLLAVFLISVFFGGQKTSALNSSVRHEWIGLLVLALLIFHLVLYWKQIIQTLERFAKTNTKQKIFAIIDILILAMVILSLLSGIIISEQLGFGKINSEWRLLHHVFPKLALLLILLHTILRIKKIKTVLWTGDERKVNS